MIGGNTRIFGVIGDPISHTLSPLMFNAAFHELGLDCVYVPFRVEKNSLEAAIAGMRALNIPGLNVTIPHKADVIELLDSVDAAASAIGAVNTIVNENGVLTGYNTDGQGFLNMLSGQGIEVQGKNIIILGAGGAAMAVAFALAERKASIIILNRTLSRAQSIRERIYNKLGVKTGALELNRDNLGGIIGSADILVNATSIGMKPDTDSTPVDADLLKPGPVIVDIVYNPMKTRLLAEAEKAGCRTIAGIHMLVAQGAVAFEKWTGQKAPVELMSHIAVKELEKA